MRVRNRLNARRKIAASRIMSSKNLYLKGGKQVKRNRNKERKEETGRENQRKEERRRGKRREKKRKMSYRGGASADPHGLVIV